MQIYNVKLNLPYRSKLRQLSIHNMRTWSILLVSLNLTLTTVYRLLCKPRSYIPLINLFAGQTRQTVWHTSAAYANLYVALFINTIERALILRLCAAGSTFHHLPHFPSSSLLTRHSLDIQ